MAKGLGITAKNTALALCIALAAAGCAASKQMSVTPPLPVHFVLTPLDIELGLEGVSAKDGAAVFENNKIRLSAKSVSPQDTRLKKTAFEALNNLFYMFVEFEISNKSLKPVIYKPNYTHLRTRIGNYIMPSNYTDIYDILAKLKKDDSPEPEMREIRGLYYDSDITIAPGQSVTRLLIFERLTNESLNMEAAITIEEIYIGTEAIETALPFKVLLYEWK